MKRLALAALVIGAVGCSTTAKAPAIPPRPAAPVIAEAVKTVETATRSTTEAAQKIRTHATVIQAQVPDPIAQEHAAVIQAEATVIEDQAAPVAKAVAELGAAVVAVQNAEKQAGELTKTLAAKTAEIAELKSKQNALLHRTLTLFVLAGTVLVAVSIYLFVSGNPKAMAGGLAGGALILASMAVTVLTKLTMLFVVLAGLGVAAIVAGLAYHAWLYMQSRKAVKQIVETVEMIKPELPANVEDRLFGNDERPGAVARIQDAETKALVKAARAMK